MSKSESRPKPVVKEADGRIRRWMLRVCYTVVGAWRRELLAAGDGGGADPGGVAEAHDRTDFPELSEEWPHGVSGGPLRSR